MWSESCLSAGTGRDSAQLCSAEKAKQSPKTHRPPTSLMSKGIRSWLLFSLWSREEALRARKERKLASESGRCCNGRGAENESERREERDERRAGESSLSKLLLNRLGGGGDMRNECEGENSVFEEEKRQDLSTPAPGGDPLEKQLSLSLVKNRRELFHFFSFLGRRRLRPRPPRDLWSCLSLKFFFVFSSSALSLSLSLSLSPLLSFSPPRQRHD